MMMKIERRRGRQEKGYDYENGNYKTIKRKEKHRTKLG
jgi:hypothetical protein